MKDEFCEFCPSDGYCPVCQSQVYYDEKQVSQAETANDFWKWSGVLIMICLLGALGGYLLGLVR